MWVRGRLGVGPGVDGCGMGGGRGRVWDWLGPSGRVEVGGGEGGGPGVDSCRMGAGGGGVVDWEWRSGGVRSGVAGWEIAGGGA